VVWDDITVIAESPRFLHPQFQTDVTKPMLIDQIADHNVRDPLDIFGYGSKVKAALPFDPQRLLV
jgi:hypothetical protein